MKRIVLIMIAVLMVGSCLKAQIKDTTINQIDKIELIKPQFPDGLEGWSKYLRHNLDMSLPPMYMHIPEGKKFERAIVNVTFLVDKEGKVSDVNADSLSIASVHEKLVSEAIRVIKYGPKWIPAWQGGHTVAYRTSQKITFVVSNP